VAGCENIPLKNETRVKLELNMLKVLKKSPL